MDSDYEDSGWCADNARDNGIRAMENAPATYDDLLIAERRHLDHMAGANRGCRSTAEIQAVVDAMFPDEPAMR